MQIKVMPVMAVRCISHGLESVKDQVSADVGSIVQVSKPDLMAKGVALDLLQMAKRVGPQYEAAEYEDLSGKENLPLDRIDVYYAASCRRCWASKCRGL